MDDGTNMFLDDGEAEEPLSPENVDEEELMRQEDLDKEDERQTELNEEE
jgi:hypothetical protein